MAIRTNQELQRLFPISTPLVLTRDRVQDIIDNRMWINIDYLGVLPGELVASRITLGRNLKITTLGNHNGRLYFRGWQYNGASLSAGFLTATWRLFMVSRTLLVTWGGAYWSQYPPGYKNTDKLLTNLYNL